MKNFVKVALIFSIVVCSFSLVACGGNTTSSAAPESTASVESVA